MMKNLSQRVVMSWRNCASLLTSCSEGFSSRILRRSAGSRRRWSCSSDAQAVELAVARPDRERVERGTDAEHDSDRPAGDLRRQL